MKSKIKKRKCLVCSKSFEGNDNKKFCSEKCKNAYNNGRRKEETGQTGKVISILKHNRRAMEMLLDGKEVTNVKEQTLLDNGFVFRYHTHTRANHGDQKEYIFCFEYGYHRKENGWCTIVKGTI
ncbi:MAG: DUF2116 family Zn-ribbon domain-containing protein [Agriterribacter sp.]